MICGFAVAVGQQTGRFMVPANNAGSALIGHAEVCGEGRSPQGDYLPGRDRAATFVVIIECEVRT